MDAFTSSQDGHGGSRPSLKYKKLIHFLKGEWHTSLRHTKNVCQLLLQPPEPDPQTGHHEQLVFEGHHCQPTSTSHVLPASFLVRSTHLAEDFLLHLNTQRFPESFPLDDRQTVDPEMNASANRRFLSRSQKRVCESATFELAFSHSRRQVDAPFLPPSRFLCSSICFPAFASSSRTWHRPTGQLQRQHQCLRWQAASSPLSHAHVQLQRQNDRSQPSEGRGGGSVKTNGLEKKLKLEADDSERQTDRFPCLCSVSAYFSACDLP